MIYRQVKLLMLNLRCHESPYEHTTARGETVSWNLWSDDTIAEDAGPNDEERGRPRVPLRTSLARSSSSVGWCWGPSNESLWA
jgi:hypothetical protein